MQLSQRAQVPGFLPRFWVSVLGIPAKVGLWESELEGNFSGSLVACRVLGA